MKKHKILGRLFNKEKILQSVAIIVILRIVGRIGGSARGIVMDGTPLKGDNWRSALLSSDPGSASGSESGSASGSVIWLWVCLRLWL